MSNQARRPSPFVAAALAAALVSLLVPAVALAQPAADDMFTRNLQRGPLFAGGAAFLGGLLVSLTPCVYPMIAITVSVFGAKQAKSRKEAMLLSTSFVAGMVVFFTAMLVGAALTGGIFGALLANKWVVIALAAVFIAMAASMFGAFDLTLPEGMMQRLSSVGGIGLGGAFILGLVCGPVTAPCTGPVLTGILIYIGTTRSVLLGSLAGFTFALGLGLPFWLVGTFAIALPKGGKWMMGVKSFFGIVMLVVAFYYLKTPFPKLASFSFPTTTFLAVTAAVAVAGLALGAVHLAWDDGGSLVKVRKGLGIALTTVGLALFVAAVDKPREADSLPTAMNAAPGATPVALLRWLHSEPDATTLAATEKRPLMVDFTAEWCGACKEMAKETFADPRVMAKAANFVAVKVDATDDEDPQVDKVKGKYKVVGLPTVVIYDSKGVERKRFNQFVGPEKFLQEIEGID